MNAATDLLRRRGKERDTASLDDEERPVQLIADTPDPAEAAEASERREILQRAVQSLSENHRKILLLRAVSGLDYREIGEILELSPGTVKSRLARARQELREKLQTEGNYFPPPASKQRKGDEGDGTV